MRALRDLIARAIPPREPGPVEPVAVFSAVVRPAPEFDPTLVYDRALFGLTAEEILDLGPVLPHILEVAYEALERSGLRFDRLRTLRMSTILAGSSLAYITSRDAALVADILGLPGPATTLLDTSGLLGAVHSATQAIRAGDIDVVVVVGDQLDQDPVSNEPTLGGVGAVVLGRTAIAQDQGRVRALILGSAMNRVVEDVPARMIAVARAGQDERSLAAVEAMGGLGLVDAISALDAGEQQSRCAIEVGDTHEVVLVVGSAEPASRIDQPPRTLALSARTAPALRSLVIETLARMGTEDDLSSLASDALGRPAFEHRLALPLRGLEDARTRLEAYLRDDSTRLFAGYAVSAPIAFVIPPAGAQYVGMGDVLYSSEPVFREAMNRCDRALRSVLPRPLLSVLFPAKGREVPVDDPIFANPLTFAFAFALAELYRSRGLVPDAVLGCGVGELAAAAIAGAVDVEEAVRVSAERGRLLVSLNAEAARAVIGAPEAVVRKLIERPADVDIVALPMPDRVVIGGTVQETLAVVDRAVAAGLPVERMAGHPNNTPLVEPVLAEFAAAAAALDFQTPEIAWVSAATGRRTEHADALHWASTLRSPMRFSQSVETLYSLGCRSFVELAPRPTLLAAGQRTLSEQPSWWFAALDANRNDRNQIEDVLSALWVLGASNIDFGPGGRYPSAAELPCYPWDRRPLVDEPEPVHLAAELYSIPEEHTTEEAEAPPRDIWTPEITDRQPAVAEPAPIAELPPAGDAPPHPQTSLNAPHETAEIQDAPRIASSDTPAPDTAALPGAIDPSEPSLSDLPPSLPETPLPGPALTDQPALSEPVAVLPEPVLPEPVLPEPVLPEPVAVLPEPVLPDQAPVAVLPEPPEVAPVASEPTPAPALSEPVPEPGVAAIPEIALVGAALVGATLVEATEPHLDEPIATLTPPGPEPIPVLVEFDPDLPETPLLAEEPRSEATPSATALPEPVLPEPVLPEPAPVAVLPEPVLPELVLPEPVPTEPVLPEPVLPEPVLPEPMPAEPSPPERPSPSLPPTSMHRSRIEELPPLPPIPEGEFGSETPRGVDEDSRHGDLTLDDLSIPSPIPAAVIDEPTEDHAPDPTTGLLDEAVLEDIEVDAYIARAPKTLAEAEQAADAEVLWEERWVVDEMPVNTSLEPTTWVILADAEGVGDYLATLLESQGNRILRVLQEQPYPRDDGTLFVPDPTVAKSWEVVVEALGSLHGPVRILHLWALDSVGDDQGAPGSTISEVDPSRGWAGVIGLIKELQEQGVPARIHLVTRGALRSTELAQAYSGGSLWGLAAVLAVELPFLFGGIVDLEPDDEDPEALLKHLLGGGTDALPIIGAQSRPRSEHVFRNGERWRRTIELVHSLPDPHPIDKEGAWVIAGDIDTNALELAQWFANNGVSRIFLVSHLAPPPEVLRGVLELQRKSIGCIVVRTDPTDPKDVIQIRTRLAREPKIGGMVLRIASDPKPLTEIDLTDAVPRWQRILSMSDLLGDLVSDAQRWVWGEGRALDGAPAAGLPAIAGAAVAARVQVDMARGGVSTVVHTGPSGELSPGQSVRLVARLGPTGGVHGLWRKR